MRPNSLTYPNHVNKLHQTRKSINRRLLRCTVKKSIFSNKQVVCPFDRYHVVDESYLARHIINCASSSNSYKSPVHKNHKTEYVVPLNSPNAERVPVMQDWSYEDSPTYDPYVATEGRNIIRYLIVAPKKQKKHFRMNERIRIQLLNQTNINGPQKEFCDKIQNLDQDLLWEVLVSYMKRLNVTCFDTILENTDFDKLVIKDSNTLPGEEDYIKNEDTDGLNIKESIVNIDVEKLFNSKEGNSIIRQESSHNYFENSLISQLEELEINV